MSSCWSEIKLVLELTYSLHYQLSWMTFLDISAKKMLLLSLGIHVSDLGSEDLTFLTKPRPSIDLDQSSLPTWRFPRL